MFLLEADNIGDWNQKQHVPSVASASTTRLQFKRHTYWILNRNQSKLTPPPFFFLGACVWKDVAYGTAETEMQKASVFGSGLSLWEGICYLCKDKGNCGVSVYGAELIASPLKDPTYGTLIDSWQRTQWGLLQCFCRNPSVGVHASMCLLCSFEVLPLSKQELSHIHVICVERAPVRALLCLNVWAWSQLRNCYLINMNTKDIWTNLFFFVFFLSSAQNVAPHSSSLPLCRANVDTAANPHAQEWTVHWQVTLAPRSQSHSTPMRDDG